MTPDLVYMLVKSLERGCLLKIPTSILLKNSLNQTNCLSMNMKWANYIDLCLVLTGDTEAKDQSQQCL